MRFPKYPSKCQNHKIADMIKLKSGLFGITIKEKARLPAGLCKISVFFSKILYKGF
jgi:hypothetical protein